MAQAIRRASRAAPGSWRPGLFFLAAGRSLLEGRVKRRGEKRHTGLLPDTEQKPRAVAVIMMLGRGEARPSRPGATEQF